MPLPPSARREPQHGRVIECRGYRREDGLWDIEGHLTDRKTTAIAVPQGRPVPAGEPIHEMWIRLTVDEDLLVHDVCAVTDHSPYPACPAAAAALAGLRGLRIAAGWTAEVRRRFGGRAGCTHLTELLGPVATTAYQTLSTVRMARPEELDAEGRPRRIDSCFAYAADGDLVRQRWPDHHAGPPPERPAAAGPSPSGVLRRG